MIPLLFHFHSTGGKIGITVPSFQSSPAGGPIMPWESPHSYPAINGYTLLHEVTFSGFQNKCGKRHRAIMSNSWVGDILHPMDIRGLLTIFHFQLTWLVTVFPDFQLAIKQSFQTQVDVKFTPDIGLRSFVIMFFWGGRGGGKLIYIS